MSEVDVAAVGRLRDLLDRYRPSARPVIDELVHELRKPLECDCVTSFRVVRGELGWSTDYVYCTDAAATVVFAQFLKTAPDGWTEFFPSTPIHLRNRALRPKVVHRRRLIKPNAASREIVAFAERVKGYGMAKDDLGISVCDGDVVLGWIGATRTDIFGARELGLIDAIAPSLKARMLLEHQLGQAAATRALLEAALEAIPAATFIVAGSAIAHANATGRALLDRDRTGAVDMLRASLTGDAFDAPFAITPVESPGIPPLALAVLRGGDSSAERFDRRVARFSGKHGLSPRQSEVLALLARGYGNKTIAERVGISEGTVEEHVTKLFRKIGTDSRATLVATFWLD